ncbi:MAG: dephospho-CoA kinase [Anaerocolumna sp.]
MRVIGITGGIGSGKSVVCEMLKNQYGAFLINMDQIAHSFMEPGNVSYELIVKHFGQDILDEKGHIDRRKLGEIVYKEEEQLKCLNSFTHPYVLSYVRELIKEKRKSNENLVCVESALPIEGKLTQICDEVWYVRTSDSLRSERLRENRKYTTEKIDGIFKKQISEEQYKEIGTKIIWNESSYDVLLKQIEILLKE